MAFGPAPLRRPIAVRTTPSVHGLGICVRCRRVLCAECSTKIDRMNFCTACLAALGSSPAAAAEARPASPLLGEFLLAASTVGLALLFALFGLLLANLRPGP